MYGRACSKRFFYLFCVFGVITIPLCMQAESNSQLESSTKSTAIGDPKKIIGGIAIKVNGDPITLYEIQHTMQTQHFSKTQAQDFLVAQCLKKQEIKRLNIVVDEMRLDQEVQAVAAQNRMSYQQFLNALYQEGITLEIYKERLKDQIQTRELMRNILLSSDVSSEEEMRKYYNNHRDDFIIPTEIQTMRYSAKDPKLLERAISNTLVSINGVEKTPEKLTLNMLNPQIAQMFSSIQTGQFTPILDAGNGRYVAFLVQEKLGESTMSFEEAKNYIAQKIAQTSQDQILDEYFEKIKLKAHIEYVRLP